MKHYILLKLKDGTDPVEVQEKLWKGLRKLDDEGAEHIFSEAVDARGVGLAVMNRLGRAAAFHIEKV